MILGTKIRILSDFRLMGADFIRFSLYISLINKAYPRLCLPIPAPVLIRTCARAYLYLCPRLPVPAPVWADSSFFRAFLSGVAKCVQFGHLPNIFRNFF